MLPSVNGHSKGTAEIRDVFRDFPNGKHAAQGLEEIRVRAYESRDRAAIRRICCDTGFLGKPIDSLFQDRELFADLFTGAYLEYEPDSAFVAEAKGRVVGYLLGSVRSRFDLILMRNGFPIASKMVWKLLAGRYKHSRSRRFVKWLLTVGYHEQPNHPDNSGHLHLDLDVGYRGRGIARRLWNAFAERLHFAGVKHCYGSFFSYPGCRPETVYARYGFEVFDRKATTLFEPEVSNVEVVCVSKPVTGQNGA